MVGRGDVAESGVGEYKGSGQTTIPESLNLWQ